MNEVEDASFIQLLSCASENVVNREYLPSRTTVTRYIKEMHEFCQYWIGQKLQVIFKIINFIIRNLNNSNSILWSYLILLCIN